VAVLDAWTAGAAASAGGTVTAAGPQPGGDALSGAPAWYVRMRGEEKEVITVWLALRQRTLFHHAQLMPAPEEAVRETWEYLLRRNADLFGMAFALGHEGGVELVGRVPVERVDDTELDRIVGTTLACVEECFPTAMALGFGARFRRRPRTRPDTAHC